MADLEERELDTTGLSQFEQRKMLELVLREEEEWQQMVMYRRDTRFAVAPATGTAGSHRHRHASFADADK